MTCSVLLVDFYVRQHICYSMYMLSPVRLSVRRVDHGKMVDVRIMKFLPYSPHPTSCCRASFVQKFWGVPPPSKVSNNSGVGKNRPFSIFKREYLENGSSYG